MIDLHCHSFYSDGVSSPAELVKKALDKQLTCLSLTDHDTLAGFDELYQAALNTPLTVIKGIELSVRWKKYDIHILGYQMPMNEHLDHLVIQQVNSRIVRAKQISQLLNESGVDNAYEKACAIAGHERVGRPHFAQVLVNEGRVRDMQAAFKQFLKRGRSAYVPTPWVELSEAVSTIKRAKGQAVIAHPLKYGLTRSKLHELIREFKEAGGDGLEVVSGNTTTTEANEMAATSQRFDLLASSGSDFHGENVSMIKLGCQRQLPLNCTPIWHNWTIKQGN